MFATLTALALLAQPVQAQTFTFAGTGDTGTDDGAAAGTDTGTAGATDPTTGATDPTAGGGTAGDAAPPSYDVYLRALRDAGINAPEGPPDTPAQLDFGLVGLLDSRGYEIGRIVVTDPNVLDKSHYREEVFFHDAGVAFNPGDSFGFRYLSEDVFTQQGQNLVVNVPAGFEQREYLNFDFNYTGVPEYQYTELLTTEADITRWTFLIVQNQTVQGWMLREHHHEPNHPEVFFDHWVMLPGYDMPSEPNETARMVHSPEPFETTADFLQWCENKNLPGMKYAQIEYVVELGDESQFASP